MPPRSLTGTLFGTAAASWGLLALEGGGPSTGFWIGLVLTTGPGAAGGNAPGADGSRSRLLR